MKIWYGYGSEHSQNLVMIGEFEGVKDARDALRLIEEITGQVYADEEVGNIVIGEHLDSYSSDMKDLMRKFDFWTIGTDEVQQFAYDVKSEIEDNRLVVTTDESDISGFLKVMLRYKARVEVYSAHDHSGTGYGRGT